MIQWSIDLIIFTNWTHFIRILLDFIKSLYFQQYCMNHKCYRFIELPMRAKAFFKLSQVKSQFSNYLKLLTENDRKWAIGPANESIELQKILHLNNNHANEFRFFLIGVWMLKMKWSSLIRHWTQTYMILPLLPPECRLILIWFNVETNVLLIQT